MPFTFSHPVYAWPLRYISPKYMSITGLVLGSMAPDFEYFLMLEPFRSIGHSITGLFVQAIPLCVLFAIVFHYIMKESLALHLPSAFQLDRRAYNILGEWGLRNLKDWIVFIYSVVLGFISHVSIDALTHAHGYFVIRYSLLRNLIIFHLPLYKILQYSLSVLGLLTIVAVIMLRLYWSNPSSRDIPRVTKKQKVKYWSVVIAVTMVTTGLKITLTTSVNIVGILVVAPISGIGLGLLLASIITRNSRKPAVPV